MNADDFSDIPKETIMIIGDMDKFIEFIAFNSIRKAVYKIMFSLFDNQNYATKLIEKYVIRHNVSLREFVKIESEKYFVKTIYNDKNIKIIFFVLISNDLNFLSLIILLYNSSHFSLKYVSLVCLNSELNNIKNSF